MATFCFGYEVIIFPNSSLYFDIDFLEILLKWKEKNKR